MTSVSWLLQKELTVETALWQMDFGHNRQAVDPGHGHGFLFIDQIATPA